MLSQGAVFPFESDLEAGRSTRWGHFIGTDQVVDMALMQISFDISAMLDKQEACPPS